jgi:hypothetical protein
MKGFDSRSRRTRAAVTLTAAAVAAVGLSRWGSAADHRDSMTLTADPAADIADVYSFLSPTNANNVVFAMTVSGLIPPAEARNARFDPDVLYQIKIDNTGDAVEDLVIQAWVTGSEKGQQVMHFRGPVAPTHIGATGMIVKGEETASVRVSTGSEAITARRHDMNVFAGVRDDPFFFDLGAFRAIIAGQATKFSNPGTDTFAGTNVLAIVVEVPKSFLGSNPNLKVWGTTSRPN